ncbi:MAG TPA: DUF4157 domain-containing protein [Ideonella sp.]|nr:DUF4157 domain-containing protein [Ideonella sp.]
MNRQASRPTTRAASTASTASARPAGAWLQRRCACGTHTPSGETCPSCARAERLQRRAFPPAARVDEQGGGEALAPELVHQVLRTPGQPLDAGTRAFMEPRFGAALGEGLSATPAARGSGIPVGRSDDPLEQQADRSAERVLASRPGVSGARRDFSAVRVHTDAQASASARAVGALAYTVGRHVVLDGARYTPQSSAGRQLLAHELSHVLQQGGAGTGGAARLQRQAAGPAAAPPGGAPPVVAPPGGAPPASGLSDEMLKQIARHLREAMAGAGTDEDAIYAALAGRTQVQVDEIGRVYHALYDRDLGADLRGDLNAGEMRHLALFSPGSAPGSQGTPAVQSAGLAQVVAGQLQRAMKGLGTDEAAIFSALTGRTPDERLAIRQAYRQKAGHELEADLRSELSGGELRLALLLLNQGVLEPEDEIFLAVEGLGTDEDTIMRVLRELSATPGKLTAMQTAYQAKYGDLIQDLRGDLNSDEYATARKWLRPELPDADVEDCDSSSNPLQQPNTVRDAHARAFELLSAAIRLSANPADPQVVAMAAKYFHIALPATTPQQVLLWHRARRAMETMLQGDSAATYECEPEQSFGNGFCSPGVVAVSLFNIHLCPQWWLGFPTVDDRAAILVHEWGHKWGAGVNRVFETYCHSPGFQRQSADDLVTQPDAYMGFVVELVTGSTPMRC